MPKASESVTTVRKPGLLRKLRTARRKSCATLATNAKGSLMGAPPECQLLPASLLSEHGLGYHERLPDSLDMIFIEDSIVAEDGNVFCLRLGDQHSVEWISVLPWEPSGAQRMFHADREGFDSQLFEIEGKVTDQFLPGWQLAQTNFGAYLQSRYSTDQDLITAIFDEAPCA